MQKKGAPLVDKGRTDMACGYGASLFEGDKLRRNRVGLGFPNLQGCHFNAIVNEAVHDQSLKGFTLGIGLAV